MSATNEANHLEINVTYFPIEVVANESRHRIMNGSEYPVRLMTFTRINSLMILIENATVLMCLFIYRSEFSKREFWLHLTSLNINDLLVGVVCFGASFVEYDTFENNKLGCASLFVSLVVSQLTLLYNVLSICVYRLLFLVSSNKLRFSWTPSMTVIQLGSVYIFSTLYAILPLLLWGRKNQYIRTCAHEYMFGSEVNKLSAYLGFGFLFPLLILNILYCVTFCKIRRQYTRRYFPPVNDEGIDTGSASSDRITRQKKFGTVYKHRNIQAPDDATRKLQANFDSRTQLQETHLREQNNGNANCSIYEKNAATEQQPSKSNKRTGNNESKSNFRQLCRTYSERTSHTSHSNSRSRNIQKQSLVLIGAILLSIDVTILPSIVVLVVTIIVPTWSVSVTVMYAVGIIAMNNSLINPWIYTLQSKELRKALKKDIRHYSVRAIDMMRHMCKSKDM